MTDTPIEEQRRAAIARRRATFWTTEPSGLRQRLARAPRAREDDPSLIHPQRDEEGRPRVRVLVVGAIMANDNATSRAFFSLIGPDRRWPSRKREYEFVRRSGWSIPMSDDPSCPLIGVVYAPFAKRNSVADSSGGELWLYAAVGYPPPVLWLQGIKSHKLRDDNVLCARESVDALGYRGDECAIVCAPKVDRAALSALVDELDVHFDGRELLVREAPSNLLARATLDATRVMLDDLVVDVARFERMASSVEAHGYTEHAGATLAELATMLLEHGQLALCARVLRTMFVRDERIFERWARAAVERRAMIDTSLLVPSLEAYAALAPDAAFGATLALFDRTPNAYQAGYLAEALRLVPAPTGVAQLEVAIAGARDEQRRSMLVAARARMP